MNISDTFDTDVADPDDTSMTSMTWTVGGITDGNSEVLSINGTNFALGTDVSTPVAVAVNGTTFDITYNSTTGLFTFAKNGSGGNANR